jgi:hypothetical protein
MQSAIHAAARELKNYPQFRVTDILGKDNDIRGSFQTSGRQRISGERDVPDTASRVMVSLIRPTVKDYLPTALLSVARVNA